MDASGTRDFAPEEYRLRQWLFGEFERVSHLFGFEQFETPVLESEDLFVRKAGEEITQQLYNFEAGLLLTAMHVGHTATALCPQYFAHVNQTDCTCQSDSTAS